MKTAKLLFVSSLVATLAAPALAAGLTATAVVCTGVKNRAPVGAADTFPSSVGRLTCFSEVRGTTDKIVHVWYHGNTEVRRIELPVRAERWRTWSVKTIPAKWTGEWRVEVQGADGSVLATARFKIE
jgi:hypothetical protein